MAHTHSAYGRRLLPSVIAERAKATPDVVIYTISIDRKTYAKGSRDLTYKDFDRAVDRLAWFLDEHVGKTTTNDTLAYLGPNDLRYFILVLAIAKTGNNVLLTSPRNSLSNHLHLINKTSCATFLKTSVTNIDPIVSACPTTLNVIDIPELDDLFAQDEVPEYPYEKTFEEAKNDKVVILHSSGTTGQVKPIPITHRSCAAIDEHHYLRNEDGKSSVPNELPGRSCLHTMPLFHAAALFMHLFLNVFFEKCSIMYPPDAPVNITGVVDMIKYPGAVNGLIAPSMLEDASQSEEAINALKTLGMVIYGGGAMSDIATGILAENGVILQNYIGGTESGAYPIYPHTDYIHDSEYLRFKPNEPGIKFRHHSEGLYELVFVRHSGPQSTFTFDTFPDKQEYSTSDLYRPHPTKPGLWKHAGRADDVIVLSNGEKVVPSVPESILAQGPEVRQALLYGQKRFEVAALVELEKSASNLSREELVERLTPYLDHANKEMPGHAQLSKERILFVRPEKPFTRLPKGSVARKATFVAFEMEIDQLYSNETSIPVSETPLLKDASKEQTIAVLTEIVLRASELPSIEADQDFLQIGVDSLKVITIVRHIRAQLKQEGADVPSDSVDAALVYASPTIADLADAIRSLGRDTRSEAQSVKNVDQVKQMFEKYAKDLPAAAAPTAGTQPSNDQRGKLTVILTGSTGSLGSYLLDSLLANKRVARIFSINRSAEGRTKQIQSSSTRGLSIEWGERVHFLHADLSKPLLGLERPLYDRLVDSATHIIHNQWPVNFNHPLSTFEPQVRGVRHLIDLAHAAPHKPAILFTSSVGTVANWTLFNPGQPVPEAEITDVRVATPNGYSSSKAVSERLLAAAASKSGVRSLVVRVGQLAGSVDKGSVWNKDEWFPSIVASSHHLGLLPSDIGPLSNIEFVPVDRAANILLDLCMNQDQATQGATFFNLVNPHPVAYKDLVPALQSALKPMPRLVPYADWVQALKASAKDPQADLAKNPAVKLVDFYDSLARGDKRAAGFANNFQTKNAQEWSENMRKLGFVKPEWMTAWVHGLGF